MNILVATSKPIERRMILLL